jgi:hypothetical protein
MRPSLLFTYLRRIPPIIMPPKTPRSTAYAATPDEMATPKVAILPAKAAGKKRQREAATDDEKANNGQSAKDTAKELVHAAESTIMDATQRRKNFVEAIKLDPLNARAWLGLGAEMSDDYDAEEIDGEQHSQCDCFVKCLELDPLCVDGWITIFDLLEEDYTMCINGRWEDQRGCLAHILEIAPAAVCYWGNLFYMMEDDETVTIGGQQLTKEDVRKKAKIQKAKIRRSHC